MFSRIISASAVLILATHLLHAQPVIGDDPEFGAGSITVDPSQNLVFLDLTVTKDIPFATMQTELLPGGAYERWRYATPGEVAALANSFGWTPPITNPTDTAGILVNSSTVAQDIVNAIGITSIGFLDSELAFGFLQDEDAIFISWRQRLSNSSLYTYSPIPDIESFDLGHWLVRDLPTQTPTYQGTLAEMGTPVDSDADFRVSLVTQFGIALETIEHTQVPVTDGLFTIPLSFDPTLFETPGAALRIEVRAPSGAGDYETISPDQPISPAPSAVFAQRAAVASALSNQESRPLTLFAGTEIYGAGYLPPTATRIGNTVTLNGLVRYVGNSDIPAGTTFAILDEGMRPNGRLVFLQASSAGAYRIDVKTDGTLSFQGAPGVGSSIDWVSLDGISFTLD
ncbi:MAG: hypothetical protein RLN78_05840 [Phycisphaerales bacterium]